MADIMSQVKKCKYTYEDCVEEIVHYVIGIQNGVKAMRKEDKIKAIEYIE